MTLNCIIVDDEKTSRVAISSLVDHNDSLNLVGMAESGEQALELLEKREVDVIFLDVMMPSMSGFDFLDEIEYDNNVRVVLVTGNKDFAVKAFDYAISDYLVKPVSRNRFEESVQRILRSVSVQSNSDFPNNLLLQKLIRFMHSRDINFLEPVRSRKSLLGYTYAMLTDNLEFANEADALEILEKAEENEILNGKFVDTIYLCNSCSNSYLNIREVCPNCDSSHLVSNDLVHHFSCAYMGEISEFKVGGYGETLICPKCEKKLKHIGVDYDKPAAIFNCKGCAHSFQDPLIHAKCLNCGTDQKVEHLLKKEIKKYHLTATGKDMAEGNHYVKMRRNGEQMPDEGQSSDYFIRALKNEIRRKNIAEFESSVGIFRLWNISELHQRIGNTAKRDLQKELQQILSNELAAGDEITFWDYETILMLFPEQRKEEVNIVMDQMAERMKELIKDNFDDFELELKMAVSKVRENVSYEQIINNLLEKTSKSNV
jgi:response regulator of citrate/malate metabolism